MKETPCPDRVGCVRLVLHLPQVDVLTFESAVRMLKRIMRREAPDVPTLMRFNLTGNDARGLADQYLDVIGWPLAAGRTVSLRTRRKPAALMQRRAARSRRLRDEPDDPSRN